MTPAPNGAAAEPRSLERGETVGRFVLIGLLGRGGMGEVYAAYDPELDRKVAVKILRARSDDGEARLLREAQAIARLQHPNVVVVFDVGKFHDTVFIAMEFVDGVTLGYWVQNQPRTWRETLRLYRAAGQGLAAAHEMGMVHRDFKPDNAMLTKDGQVRVMDFGLARQMSEVASHNPLTASQIQTARAEARMAMNRDRGADDPDLQSTRQLKRAPGDDVNASSGAGILSLKLTRTGAQIGTPAYMAPEQFTPGRAMDARTDQFSFCVALYEALYGERPFEGDTLVVLTASVLQGDVRPPPDKTNLPSWVRRVLLRGLSTDPAKRFPSMKDLLAALDADPGLTRRRWALAFTALVLATGLAVTANRLGAGNRTLCDGGGSRLEGLWEADGALSPRKATIKIAFAKTGKAFAAQAFVGTAKLLDDYVARWTTMYKDACRATHVRGDQSAEVLDLRMSCLSDRLGNVRALTDVFVRADEGVVENAVTAAGALPSLDECANVSALRAVVKPPTDPATRNRVAELRDELARVTAVRDSGQCQATEARGVPLVAEIRATKYQPLISEALYALGFLWNFCGDPEVSLGRLKEAYVEATASHDDLTAAEAAVGIPTLAVNRLGRVAEARDWVEISRGAIERVGGNDLLESALLSGEGSVFTAEHDFDRAVTRMRQAQVLSAKVLGSNHPLSILALSNVGNTLLDAGRPEEALAADRAARAAGERLIGAEHPQVAGMLSNECEALNRLGRFAEARVACERALGIWRTEHIGPAIQSFGLTGLGLSYLGEGDARDAILPLEAAVTARTEGRVGRELLGESRFALARALWSRPSDRARALALAREARGDSTTAAASLAIEQWLAKADPGP